MADTSANGLGPEHSRMQGERVLCVLSQARVEDDGVEVDLMEVWHAIRDGRWWILLMTLLAGAAGVAYALLATPWYRAEVLLSPVEADSSERALSQLARLGGLAGLAGVNIGGQNQADALAVLSSMGFARSFIEEEGLVETILAGRWNPFGEVWRGRRTATPPDVRDAAIHFDKKVRHVAEDRKTGLVKLTVEWHDPELAAAWANKMVSKLNERMRARALADAQTNVTYLQSQIAATDLVSLQQAIGRLLEIEIQKLMLARGNKEFSFRVVDEAAVPKRRVRPKRTLIVVGALLLGGLFSIAFVVVRHRVRPRSA